MDALRVIGWFGRRNSGDEAFRDVHKLLLPNVPLSWFHSGREPLFQPDLALRDDVVLLSAGDIVSPFYFDQIPPNAKIVVYGAGIAWLPQIDFLADYKERLVAVWVRNERDVAPLVKRNIPAYYTPDIVFNLTAAGTQERPSSGRKRAYVLISDNQRAEALRKNNLRNFLTVQSFFVELAAGVDFLQDWYDVVLVPFSFDRNDFDLAAIYDFLPRLTRHENVEIMDKEMPFHEMMQFFGQASLIISAKFHGVVYALMNKIPFVAVSNARKVQCICEDNGFGSQWLSPNGMSAAAFKTAVATANSVESLERMDSVLKVLTSQVKRESQRFQDIMMTTLSQ